jgi:hypothetical protein
VFPTGTSRISILQEKLPARAAHTVVAAESNLGSLTLTSQVIRGPGRRSTIAIEVGACRRSLRDPGVSGSAPLGSRRVSLTWVWDPSSVKPRSRSGKARASKECPYPNQGS